MKKEDLHNTFIRIHSKEESHKVQKKLFDMGIKWGVHDKNIRNYLDDLPYGSLCIRYDDLTYINDYNNNYPLQHGFKEITYNMLMGNNRITELRKKIIGG